MTLAYRSTDRAYTVAWGTAGVFDFTGDGLELFFITSQQNKARTVFRIGQRRFATNPVAGTGNQNDAVL